MFDNDALLALLEFLDAHRYDFITPTPATHARVVKHKSQARDGDLRDVFGWSLPFGTLDPGLLALMRSAGIVQQLEGGLSRSALRVSRLHGRLFLHSAYPTDGADAVFFGPDSYRFADFILREAGTGVREVIDVGGGAGVGAMVANLAFPEAKLWLTDVNSQALRLARVNALHAGVELSAVERDGLRDMSADADLIVANPPYMMDDLARDYRDGGGGLGTDVSVKWAREALAILPRGGRFLLYSGSAIVEGDDRLRAALEAIPGASLKYGEIDPDVFGEELGKPAYAGVERIAAIGAVLTRD